MTPQQLAALLNGRRIGKEIAKDEELAAKRDGLVVVFGASDDLMEFRGAIYEELGANNGRTAHVCADGLLPSWDEVDRDSEAGCEKYFKRKAAGFMEIEAIWAPAHLPETSWLFKTSIPHAAFNVMEDGDVFCVGIVFALADVKPGATE